jgi:hypothetical protein
MSDLHQDIPNISSPFTKYLYMIPAGTTHGISTYHRASLFIVILYLRFHPRRRRPKGASRKPLIQHFDGISYRKHARYSWYTIQAMCLQRHLWRAQERCSPIPCFQHRYCRFSINYTIHLLVFGIYQDRMVESHRGSFCPYGLLPLVVLCENHCEQSIAGRFGVGIIYNMVCI